ncbi:MAG: tRNA uracil 4-sulfurtransferase ThiI, partial [Planctomycetota bacterium]
RMSRDIAPARTVRALVRFSGEIATKSRRTRARFQRRLLRNVKDAFESHGADATVEAGWSRLYVSGPDDRFLDPLSRVYGISSYSVLAGECRAELSEIVDAGRRLFADRVRGRRYAVRARRAGSHDFDSGDVLVRLGAALNPGAEVDLDDPEVVVRVEVRDERAYFYTDRVQCAGGLPLGVQGRAVALVSGGFDSAVAAWMALRRGVAADYLFCNLGGGAYKRMVVEVAKLLADRWSYGTYPRLHVVDFTAVVEEMRGRAKPAYLQVVLKRLMYRAASAVGAATGADAIVTGESVGQVSSQTLRNLRSIDDAADLPLLRPLLGFHKEEIIARSRQIGTYELSARVREYCRVAPGRPVTAATPEGARAQEEAVGHAALESALRSKETLRLRTLEITDVIGPNLFVSSIADGAEVLDTRDEVAYLAWHWPTAQRRDFAELERGFRGLDREKTYVLLCGQGIRTAHLAERMQEEGFEAYSFLGGVPALRRYAARRSGASRDP